MPEFFTSKRERRLWICALAVVLAIYSTLGLAATWVGRLDPALLTALFVASMVLAGTAILTQGLEVRPGGAEIGLGLGLAAAYLLVFVRLTVAERSHLIEYSVVAVCVYEAIAERVAQGRCIPVPPLVAIGVASGIGAVDEGIQFFLPGRVFDSVDILFNGLAASGAVTGVVLVRRVRSWKKKRAGPRGRIER